MSINYEIIIFITWLCNLVKSHISATLPTIVVHTFIVKVDKILSKAKLNKFYTNHVLKTTLKSSFE